MGISLDAVKLCILFGLLIMTFFFGILPVLFIKFIRKTTDIASSIISEEQRERKRKRVVIYKKILSFLSCFSAGVFLATCFLDLLPNVRHNLIQVLFNSNVYTGFPVAEFVMVVGLFFILVIEQIVLTIKEHHSVTRPTANNTENLNNVRQPLLSQTKRKPSRKEGNDELVESYHSDHSLGGLCDEPHLVHEEEDWPVPVLQETDSHSPAALPNVRPGSVSQQIPNNNYQSVSSLGESPLNHDHHHHSTADHGQKTHSPLRAMILLIALSAHSVFEGLTVGLQTTIASVLSIFGALALHKCILSFSLGMNLVQSRISVKSTVKSILLFSLSSPIGVAIGIGISDLWTSVTSGLLHGLLQGIASGTFLYVIFFEILPKEFNSDDERLLKVLFLILGYATITGVLFLSDDVKTPFCLINEKYKP